MFNEVPNGSSIEIQGLVCNLPPAGYVVNVVTKKVEYRGIYSRSEIKSEQYWERFQLPSWYAETLKRWVAHDKKKEKNDELGDFYDEQLNDYQRQEWDRRLNGFWFMNNGKPVYVTGFYYMLLQWFNIDIGYAKFTKAHLYKTYFLQYCIEDPLCMGMIDITKRRFLKTFIGGLFLLEHITRTKMVHGGIQSKKGDDAKKVFAKAVVYPFRKFPRFFRPEYDMSLGVNPKTEIRFQQTNIRGKKAEDSIDKDELGSAIDWGSADPIHYDGSKITRYFSDEFAKTTEANVYDRHEVIRYCLLDEEGRIIGKALYSSTVEKLESDKDGVQEAAKQLWDASNQNQRAENGRTQSGLYRFFQTADEASNFDKYGEPDVEKTIKDILADRKSVENNIRSLSARMRKEPRTIEEAFSADTDKCIFNVINISNRKKYLTDSPIPKRSVWMYRDIDQIVKWRDITEKEKDFHWETTWLPDKSQANKFVINNKIRQPGNIHIGGIAIDGYSNSQGGQKYGSRASAWMGLRFDPLNPNNTGKAVGWLYGRPAIKEILHEQVMLMAEYCGFRAWYEHNSDDYLSYFRERGRLGYLGVYPLSTIDPTKRADADRFKGFPTTPFSLTRQTDCGLVYFEHYCNLIDWIELLEDAEKFDPNNRTEFDTTVSFLMLLVILQEPLPIPQKPKFPLATAYENPYYSNN